MLDLVSPWPWAGSIIAGLITSRGVSFVHDFASLSPRPAPSVSSRPPVVPGGPMRIEPYIHYLREKYRALYAL